MPPSLRVPAGAPAPALSASALADVEELFPPRVPRRQEFRVPDLGKTILIEALTPKDYEEVNHAAVSYDGGMPQLDNRLWNARLIARALRRPGGQRAWKDEQGWRALAVRLAESWTISDVQLTAEAVADLSGISKKAREAMEEALGKDSSETATDLSST